MRKKIIYGVLLCLFSTLSYASLSPKNFEELLDHAKTSPQVNLSSYRWKDFDKEQTQAVLKALSDNTQLYDLSMDESALDIGIVPEIDFLLQQNKGYYPTINIYNTSLSLMHNNYPMRPYIQTDVSDKYLDQFIRGVKNIPLSSHRDELNVNWFDPEKQTKETVSKSCELLNHYLTDHPFLRKLVLTDVKDEHLKILSQGILLNPALNTLSIHNNVGIFFGGEGYMALVKSLSKTKAVKYLKLGGQTIPEDVLQEVLSLPLISLNSWCSLSASKNRNALCKVISDMMPFQKTLLSLNLTSNYLSSKEVEILLKGFEDNKILKRLDLLDNWVSSSVFHPLFEKNKSLTYLSISQFSEESIPYLEKNKTLQFLFIGAPSGQGSRYTPVPSYYVRYNPLPLQQENAALSLLPSARTLFMSEKSPLRKLPKNVKVDILRFLVKPTASVLQGMSSEWKENIVSIPDAEVLSLSQLNFIREFSEDKKTLGVEKHIFLEKLLQVDDRKINFSYTSKSIFAYTSEHCEYPNDKVITFSSTQHN